MFNVYPLCTDVHRQKNLVGRYTLGWKYISIINICSLRTYLDIRLTLQKSLCATLITVQVFTVKVAVARYFRHLPLENNEIINDYHFYEHLTANAVRKTNT